MSRGERSEVFWLEYCAGKYETLDDILDFVNQIVPGKPGIWASEEMRSVDGRQQRIIHLMICTGKSQRVNTVVGTEKWARKGRGGSQPEAGYVHEWVCRKKQEKVDDFIAKWGTKLARCPTSSQRGSAADVWAVLCQERERERQRSIQRRLPQKEAAPRTERKRRLRQSVEHGKATGPKDNWFVDTTGEEETTREVETGRDDLCSAPDAGWEMEVTIEHRAEENDVDVDCSITWRDGWMDTPQFGKAYAGEDLRWETEWDAFVEL